MASLCFTCSQGASSKLEMLAGVKSQVASSMSGWLSGGIPGLNRGGAASDAEQQAAADGSQPLDPAAAAPATTTGDSATENVKDDDASRWVAGYVKRARRRTVRPAGYLPPRRGRPGHTYETLSI